MAQSVDASAQLANLELLSKNDPAVYAALLGEEARERSGIELIPSENYAFPEVLAVLGSVFTNKYSEGYPGRRYYGGQTYTDEIENLIVQRKCSGASMRTSSPCRARV
jgi:glycine hydroxymethyltransferase